jgi:hypothetical protein
VGEYRALAFSSEPVCLTDSEPATLAVGDCVFCADPGDVDDDGDYDLADLAVFNRCFGEVVADNPPCACVNVDDSDDLIDLDDWIQLEALLTGPR